MSRLCLVLIVRVVLAIDIFPATELPSVPAETAPTVSADIAKLEAAVLAKYSSSPPVEDQPPAPAPAVSDDLAKLEAAVLAKYSSTPTSAATPAGAADDIFPVNELPNVPAEEAVAPSVPAAEIFPVNDLPSVPAEAAAPSVPADVAKLEAAVLAKYASTPAADTPAVPAQAENLDAAILAKKAELAKAELAVLEAAMQAKSATAAVAAEPAQPAPAVEEPFFNMATVEQPAASSAPVSPELAKLEAAVQAKYHTEETPTKPAVAEEAFFDVSVEPAASQPTDAAPEVSPEIAKLEAAVKAKYSETSPTKLVLQASSNSAAGDSTIVEEVAELVEKRAEVEDMFGIAKKEVDPAAVEKEAAELAEKRAEVEDFFGLSKKAEKEPAAPKQKKAAVIHESAHYRKHGMAMHHVETLAKKTRTPAQEKIAAEVEKKAEAKVAENAAKLADKRSEVENIFHIEKSESQTIETSTEAPAGVGRTLLRCFFFCAALISLGGLAYQKYEVIRRVSHQGAATFKQGAAKFKAKQEELPIGASKFKAKREDDMDDFGYRSQQTSYSQPAPSFFSSSMNKAREGLSRRGRAEPMNACDFGV